MTRESSISSTPQPTALSILPRIVIKSVSQYNSEEDLSVTESVKKRMHELVTNQNGTIKRRLRQMSEDLRSKGEKRFFIRSLKAEAPLVSLNKSKSILKLPMPAAKARWKLESQLTEDEMADFSRIKMVYYVGKVPPH